MPATFLLCFFVWCYNKELLCNSFSIFAFCSFCFKRTAFFRQQQLLVFCFGFGKFNSLTHNVQRREKHRKKTVEKLSLNRAKINSLSLLRCSLTWICNRRAAWVEQKATTHVGNEWKKQIWKSNELKSMHTLFSLKIWLQISIFSFFSPFLPTIIGHFDPLLAFHPKYRPHCLDNLS